MGEPGALVPYHDLPPYPLPADATYKIIIGFCASWHACLTLDSRGYMLSGKGI